MADEVEKKEETEEVKDTPTEDTSVEDTSVEDTSVEDTSVGETPAEDASVEDTSVKDTSIEETSVEETPQAEPEKKQSKDSLKKKKIAKVDKVALFNKKYLRDDIPEFKAGDTVRVHYRIIEGEKTRIQAYEGIVIARKHGGSNETFKVRKMSGQIGVERTFFLHSHRIDKIEVKKIGKVRRAKIYYLRGKIGKQAKIREAGLH